MRNGRVMSDSLKMEIAKELGFFDQVRADGDFGNVSSRNCGNMVKTAIQMAQRNLTTANANPL